MTVAKDIDDTTFLVHPNVPFGTTLGSLKGTPDYDMGKDMIEAFLSASGCDDIGAIALATYPWLSKEDCVSPVSNVAFSERHYFIPKWILT